MTLASLETEVDSLLSTRGAPLYDGSTFNLLVGRRLHAFADAVRCCYSHNLTIASFGAATNGYLDLESQTFTLGSDSVRVLQPVAVWVGDAMLDRIDNAELHNYFSTYRTDTAGDPAAWCWQNNRAIQFLPRNSGNIAVRVEGFYSPKAIEAGSGGSTVIGIPADCEQAFLWDVLYHHLLGIADSTTADLRRDLYQQLFEEKARLRAKYSVVSHPLGYASAGEVMRIR